MPLVDFYGEKEGLTIHFTWITADSIIENPFVVERSTNGIIWERIATIPNLTGARQYQFSDTTLSGYYSKLYYRLKQDQADLFVFLSKVLVFQDVHQSVENALIYPNPVGEGIYLNYIPSTDGWVTVKIFDITGKQLLEIPSIESGTSVLSIDVSQFLRGIYLFVMATDSETKVWKFYKL